MHLTTWFLLRSLRYQTVYSFHKLESVVLTWSNWLVCSETTQNCNGVANDAKAINVRVANKNYNIRGLYIVFEVEYLWNDLVKKNGVNANLV